MALQTRRPFSTIEQQRSNPSMKTISKKTAAFTLIELLVVITIIGILATLAPSAINGVLKNAKQAKAINGARNVGMALKMYSGEHDGSFPDDLPSIFPGYIKDKISFTVVAAKPGDSGSGTSTSLDAKEIHWTYIKGRTSDSSETLALLHDSGEKALKNWGTSAILLRVSGSVSKEPTDAKGEFTATDVKDALGAGTDSGGGSGGGSGSTPK